LKRSPFVQRNLKREGGEKENRKLLGLALTGHTPSAKSEWRPQDLDEMLALSCLLRQGRFAQEASDKTLDKLLTNVSFMAGCTVNHCMLKLNQCLSWCTA